VRRPRGAVAAGLARHNDRLGHRRNEIRASQREQLRAIDTDQLRLEAFGEFALRCAVLSEAQIAEMTAFSMAIIEPEPRSPRRRRGR